MATPVRVSALKALRRCARNAESVDVEGLGEECKAKADEWVAMLREADMGAVVRSAIPKPSRAPLSPIERLEKALRRFLADKETNGGHRSIRELLRKLAEEVGPDAPAAEAPAVEAPAAEAPFEDGDAEDLEAPSADDLAALRRRMIELHPKWSEAIPEAWNPSEALNPEDYAAITDAIKRLDTLRRRHAPAPNPPGEWPTVQGANVSPGCGAYKTKDDCVWPCAYKKGAADPTLLCRPARKTTQARS